MHATSNREVLIGKRLELGLFNTNKIKDIIIMLVFPVVSCLFLKSVLIIIITFLIIPEIPGGEEPTSMDITVVAIAAAIGAGILLTIAIAVVISTICCCIKKKRRKSVHLEKEGSTTFTNTVKETDF